MTSVYEKRNFNWKKKDQTKSKSTNITDVQNIFLCSDLETIHQKYKNSWNCEEVKSFIISEKNSFNCKAENLIIEIQAFTPTALADQCGGEKSKLEAFLQPDGIPLLENEQIYSKKCENIRRFQFFCFML